MCSRDPASHTLPATSHAARPLFLLPQVHCVVSWGRDFRPDYLSLGNLRSRYTGVPWVLLTAMLPAAMQDDLFKALDLDGARVRRIEGDLNRPKLHYELLPKSNVPLDNARAVAQILNEVRAAADADAETQQIDASRALAAAGAGANGDDAGATDDDSDDGGGGGGGGGGSAIVYVHSQHEAEKVADLLVELGITADFYHAQVEPAVRAAVHRWLRGETQAIVATSALAWESTRRTSASSCTGRRPTRSSLSHRSGAPAATARRRAACCCTCTTTRAASSALLRRAARPPPEAHRLKELLSMCEERCRRERLLAALGQTLPPGGCGGGCDVCAAAAQLVQEHDVPPPPRAPSAPSRAPPRPSVDAATREGAPRLT